MFLFLFFSARRAFSLGGGEGSGGLKREGEGGMGDAGGWGGGWVFKLGRSLCIFKRINSATGE